MQKGGLKDAENYYNKLTVSYLQIFPKSHKQKLLFGVRNPPNSLPFQTGSQAWIMSIKQSGNREDT